MFGSPWTRIKKRALFKGSRLVIFFSAGCVLFFLLLALTTPGGLELRVVPVKGGPPLLVLPLNPGERFTLHYYHSVENAPIWEEHSLDEKGRIYIEEERYLKFGAGMGRMPGVGRMVRRGPYEVIEDMHLPTGNFVLRVGSPVQETEIGVAVQLGVPGHETQFIEHMFDKLRGSPTG